MGIVQENLKKYMDDPHKNICSGGQFRVMDFNNLNKVISGTDEDFLIFDNGGGRKFDIVFDRILTNEYGEDKLFVVKDVIEHLLKNHKSWIYCYQIDKEQVILKQIQ